MNPLQTYLAERRRVGMCPYCENGSGFTRTVGYNNEEIVHECGPRHIDVETLLAIIEIQNSALKDARYALDDCVCDDPEKGHDNTNCNVVFDLDRASDSVDALLAGKGEG